MRLAATLFGAMGLFLSSSATAETMLRPTLACRSPSLLVEVRAALNTNNIDAVRQKLTAGDCLSLNAGEVVSVVRAGIVTSTIGYRGMSLFVPADAVQ